MFLSEKQTRSIFAVAGTSANTKDNIVIKKTLNGKVFGQIYVGGTTDECIVPTDKITLANIKKVAISCPMGTQRSKFEIKPTLGVLKVYPYAVLNITFPEWYGVGVDNSYMKTIAINAKPYGALSTNQEIADFFIHMRDMLKISFKRESFNPFDVTIDGNLGTYETTGVASQITEVPTKVILTEREQAFNPDNLIFRSTLNMINPQVKYIDCGTAFNHTYNEATKSDKNYSSEDWATVTPSVISADGNYYEMYELEHAGLKKGMDQHGLAGWPYVQPSKMSSVIKGSSTKTFYCLDIHYVSDRDMYEHPRQEKTLTLIASTVKTLTSVLTGMGISGDTEGTKLVKGSAATPNTKLSTIQSLTMGSSWISDLKTVTPAPAAKV